MILSVLCAALSSRRDQRKNLFSSIDKQINEVGELAEFLIEEDDGELPTGTKRNLLLDRAAGDYVVFVDDDDQVSKDYVINIICAAESNCDAIVFDTAYVSREKKMRVLHSIKHKGNFNRKNYAIRLPNHLMPIKREIALRARFPDLTIGEDFEYSQRLRLETEQKIEPDDVMYTHYDF